MVSASDLETAIAGPVCWVSCLICLSLICQMEPWILTLCSSEVERWSTQNVWHCVWHVVGARPSSVCHDCHVHEKMGIVEVQSPGGGAGGDGGWRFLLLLLLWIEWRKSPWKPTKRRTRMTLLLSIHLSSFLLFCPSKVLAVGNSQDFPSLQVSSLPWQMWAVCLWRG